MIEQLQRCFPCGKVAYPSKAEADAALVDAKIKAALRHNQRRRETRSYACPHRAGFWHLSSVEEAEYEERRAAREAREARRRAVAPFRSALRAALAGTGHAGHVDALADLLHDAGWTPPPARRGRGVA